MKQKEIQYLKAKYYYYIVGESIMLDSDFDKLEDELKKQGSEVVKIVGFPSEKEIKNFGYKLSDIVPKVNRDENKYKHLTPMLSLEKIQVNDEENLPRKAVENFLKRIIIKPDDYLECSLKYDGNGEECIYEDGKLKRILTRGDKEQGLDKTSKLKYTVPNELKNSEKGWTYQVRGEYVVDVEVWDKKYNNPEPGKISNPRNWIAGIINRDELNLDCLNDIVYVAYDLVLINEKTGETKYLENTIEVLNKFGFNTKYKPGTLKIKNYSDFEKMYFEMKKWKQESNFLIDGIVIKYPEKYRKKLGETSHHPKWAIAIKFPSEEVSSVIKDITWTMGKNRELTPIAILEPTELLGTIVKRASLSNLGNIFKIGAFPGAKVSLRKAGEIIPQIISVIEPSPNHDEYNKQFNEMLNKLS